MPRLHRQLSLVVLLALLLTALPGAAPAAAQAAIQVTNLTDVDNGGADDCGGDGCSLREAIRLANSRAGASTITFAVPGEIRPTGSGLPALTDDGTTIDGGAGFTVVLNGANAGNANGLTIRSSGNTVRGLVIYNFTGNDPTRFGAGVYIDGTGGGGDDNLIAGNRIGLDPAGSAAVSNAGYGVFLTNGASRNTIGGAADADRNVISGNYAGGVRLFNLDTLHGLLEGNSVVGNYIGVTIAGDGLPTGLNINNADSGVGVSRGSRNTTVGNNVIGGFNSSLTGAIAAGVNVTGSGTSFPLDGQSPTGTVITGNFIGVTRGGVRVPNRIGVNIGGGEYGPFDTTVGGATAAARNVIAGNGFRGVNLPDTGFIWGDATIAGNSVGLDGAGNPQPNGWSSEAGSGPGVYVGLPRAVQPFPVGRVTVGPGNVISANATYGVRMRTGGHSIRGNLLGTDTQGRAATADSGTTQGTANGADNVLLENGTGVTVGGPTLADRNVMAFSGVAINPDAVGPTNCEGQPCVSGGHTVEGNYLGLSVDGVTPLSPARDEVFNKQGVLLRDTSGNVIRGNLIGGLYDGIVMGDGTAAAAATGNLIAGNKIGAPASGEIPSATRPTAASLIGRAPRNYGDGIKLRSGSGNTVRGNLLAYNGIDIDAVQPSAGIRIGVTSGSVSGAAASDNVVEDNRVVRNGESKGWGIVVDAADNVRLARNTTQFHTNAGILLSLGGNNNRPAPTGLALQAGSPPALTGDAGGCDGCTVEVFGTTLATEGNEGNVYLASGTTQGAGTFSVPLPACLRYLTATVTDAAGNTSPFSASLDTGATGPCAPLSFSLGAATNPSRNVAPGATTVYTHTINNSSPLALSFSVVITSSQDWAAAPALVSVPANSTADFGVSVTVPPGTPTDGTVVDTSDVQVFVGAQGSNVVRDTTTPQAVTVVPATPAISGPLTQERAGPTVTFTHTVTNTGQEAGTFVLAGTPALTGAPGDWSVASATPPSLTLGPGVTGTLTIVVDTPSLPPPTSPVTLSFQLNVQGSSPLRFATQTDTITIPLARSFSFAPTAGETITTTPGATISFTYALTNTGNAADSFAVAASPASPPAPPITASIASSPALTNLAAGASSAVTVTYTVPSGTLEGSYTSAITATATGGTSPPAPQSRSVTINVTGGAAVAIVAGPPSSDPVVPVAGGAVVSFTNTLSNTGNAAAPVAVGPITGLPPGWDAEVAGSTCPTSPAELAAGAACTFVVSVTVPLGAPGGPVPLGISATAFNDPPAPDATATAVNTVTVQIVRGLELAPDGLSATAGPGQVITFTHTLTNTGNAADSFDLAVAQSDPGWTVSVTPTVVSDLPAGAPQTVEVSAVAGPGVLGGATNTITLTATGQGGGPSASVSDTASLESIPGGAIAGGGRGNVEPGATATYTFTVVNTGTVPLSYTVGLEDSATGWASAPGGVPTAVVQPGLTTTLTVSVTAPIDAAPGVTNTTTVRLLAGDGAGPTLDTATAITGIGPRLGVLLEPKGVTGQGRPNTTVILNHTVTNIGSEQGTFRLFSADVLGWEVQVTPDLVTLGPGDSVPVQVRVTVKPSAQAEARNPVKVTAELLGDPNVFDESVDEVTVPLEIGLSLSSSQVRGVLPGATTSLDSLTVFNSGSAYDFFTLTVIGEDASWDVILGRTLVGVNTGDPARVSVEVRVAAGVAPGTVKTVRIEARSTSDGTVRSSVELILTALGTANPPPPPPPQRLRTYLPMIQR